MTVSLGIRIAILTAICTVACIVIMVFKRSYKRPFRNSGVNRDINSGVNSDEPFRLVDAAELAGAPDLDAYFGSFSEQDVRARSAWCGSSCREAYLSAVVAQPPDWVKGMLAQDVRVATAILAKRAPDLLPTDGMVHVALLREGTENGWPHTHGRVVCLPMDHFVQQDAARRVETLIHELVHVYQRAHPEVVAKYMAARGYIRTNETPPPNIMARSRKNPDLSYVWRRRGDNTTSVTMFNDGDDSGMSDTRVALFDESWNEVTTPPAEVKEHDTEHPYETMAYELAHVLVNTQDSDDSNVAGLQAEL